MTTEESSKGSRAAQSLIRLMQPLEPMLTLILPPFTIPQIILTSLINPLSRIWMSGLTHVLIPLLIPPTSMLQPLLACHVQSNTILPRGTMNTLQ